MNTRFDYARRLAELLAIMYSNRDAERVYSFEMDNAVITVTIDMRARVKANIFEKTFIQENIPIGVP